MDIPPRCIYDRTTLFACFNTTFTKPIPLFNDLSYTILNHKVQIRNTEFQLSFNELFSNIGGNIETLVLLNNTFSSLSDNQTGKTYFRLLQSLRVSDEKALQWSRLTYSYYPQLIDLDLSFNHLTDRQILLFNQQNFPVLKYLNLSYNDLESLDNLTGNCLNRIERLILSVNPLKTILNKINQFKSLRYLDLSSTLIKNLFSITLLPSLDTFVCRFCQNIPMNEYDLLLSNCSLFHNHLTLDFTATQISLLHFFNPYIECIKILVFNNQNLNDSISTKDLLNSENLENLEMQNMNGINRIELNVFDRLKSIDFSNNMNLNYVYLNLLSEYVYLQRLTISRTAVKEFSVNFNQTTLKSLHIDLIDMSYSQIETIEFLKYLTFYDLNLVYNRIKIIDINQINTPPGIFELLGMHSLNLSCNQIESARINWENTSPYAIDLSRNNLKSVELHGRTTIVLYLSQNKDLSLTSKSFNIDLPALEFLDISAINFDSFEDLTYLNNITHLNTLVLNNNQLNTQNQVLNWSVFYPWRKTIAHLWLQNMSIRKINSGVFVKDYPHLLTISFLANGEIECNCKLQPFIKWLKTEPPPLPDFYEPKNKALAFDCPSTLTNMTCNDQNKKLIYFLVISITGASIIIIAIILKLIFSYIKRKSAKRYESMLIENDSIALSEQNMIKDDEE